MGGCSPLIHTYKKSLTPTLDSHARGSAEAGASEAPTMKEHIQHRSSLLGSGCHMSFLSLLTAGVLKRPAWLTFFPEDQELTKKTPFL